MAVPDLSSYKVAAGETSSATKFNNLVQAVEDAYSGIDPSQLSGYPSDTSKFLRGDGQWASPNPARVTLTHSSDPSHASQQTFAVGAISYNFWVFDAVLDAGVYGNVGIPEGFPTDGTLRALLTVPNNGQVVVDARYAVTGVPGNIAQAWTELTQQTVTASDTAAVEFALTGLSSHGMLVIEIIRRPLDASDTSANNMWLHGAWLEAA